jgi:hypothetical protein
MVKRDLLARLIDRERPQLRQPFLEVGMVEKE